jgi:hypothetical protein
MHFIHFFASTKVVSSQEEEEGFDCSIILHNQSVNLMTAIRTSTHSLSL